MDKIAELIGKIEEFFNKIIMAIRKLVTGEDSEAMPF